MPFGLQGYAKGKGKGFECKAFKGVVREFTPLKVVNGEVQKGHGKVALANGQLFAFDITDCVMPCQPKIGDSVTVTLQRVPGMDPTVNAVNFGNAMGEAVPI